MGFPGDAVVKNPPTKARDVGSVTGSGRSLGGGNGNPLWYSCLENPMDSRLQSICNRGCKGSDTTEHAHIARENISTVRLILGF